MSGPFPYGSPAALRAALTDRLKKLADSSPFTVTELHRQFAYDRLLARVFSTPDAEGGCSRALPRYWPVWI